MSHRQRRAFDLPHELLVKAPLIIGALSFAFFATCAYVCAESVRDFNKNYRARVERCEMRCFPYKPVVDLPEASGCFCDHRMERP